MPDPLEPGRIPGQNANTPERLQGEMKIGERRLPWLIGVAIALAVGLAVLLIYGVMIVDPGTKPDKPTMQEGRQ